MKICCFIHSLDGGGAERVMAGLSSRLAARGHAVTLITLGKPDTDRHEIDPRVTRRPLGELAEVRGLLPRLAAFRRRSAALRQAIVDSRPDVVLSFCDRANLLAVSACRAVDPLAALLSPRFPFLSPRFGGSREPGVPLVLAERSDPRHQTLGRIGERMRRSLYPLATTTVALTESVGDFLRRLGCRHVEVIPSAVEVPPARSDRSLADDARLVVAAGRLEPEKGFDRLLEAFSIAAKDHPGWTLKIYGEGSQRRRLESLAEEWQLGSAVALPGWVKPLWGGLAEATLFVLPSRYEGFPSALLEAMVAGVPSLVVDCDSGPRAIVRHGEDAWMVENHTDALAEGLRRMITDRDLRERLARNAPDVLARFSWDAMTDAYERVLREAADAGNARGSLKTSGCG